MFKLIVLLFALSSATNSAFGNENWLPLKTQPNKYELDINSLRYIDSKKKFLDVKYRLLIGGSENRYSVISSAITCTDTIAAERYLWELFNGDGDKLDIQRHHKSVELASKKLDGVSGSSYGIDEIRAICQYVWKNETSIPKTRTVNNNSAEKKSPNSTPIRKDESEGAVLVNKNPIAFTYKTPIGWKEGPIVSGNTKASIISPIGKPEANCAVVTIEMKGESITQKNLNENLRNLPAKQDIELELGRNWSNVKVEAIGSTVLMGYPAQNFVYQHGSSAIGWAYASTTRTVISPNIVIAVSCGGTGKTLTEAKNAYNYWQTELNIFPTTVKNHKNR